MTAQSNNDEKLAERDEVLFPNNEVIDTEPHYSNFTAIQNALRYEDEQKQVNQKTNSNDSQHRAVPIHIKPTPIACTTSNQTLPTSTQRTFNPFTIPVNIQSKRIDGHIFNLIKIIEDIGYDENTPLIRSSSDTNVKNVSALLDIVLSMGGARGPLVKVWQSRISDDYFQSWYLEKYSQRSASVIQTNNISSINTKITPYKQNNNNQSTIVMDKYHENQFKPIRQKSSPELNYRNQIYVNNSDEIDATSSTSNYSSSNELDTYKHVAPQQNKPLTITSILKKSNTKDSSQPKHRVTIREHQSTSEVNFDENHIRSDYQNIIQAYPDVLQGPNPEIITQPNPGQVTYQQNVSVRYLVPPTPPAPGPLIIREVVPDGPPSPPPLIIKYQEPPPPTPSPLIFREAPPTPPPRQEPTVITRVLPSQPPPPRRVIVEHMPPLPPKPQPIIIEKWLPYKSPPPRQVIRQRVAQNTSINELEQSSSNVQRQRRHSAELQSNLSYTPTPVDVQRQGSLNHLDQDYAFYQQSGAINDIAWRTRQQILALQQQGREQVEAHQQWAAQMWQQHSNLLMQYPTQLPTPTPYTYQPPVLGMHGTTYIQTHEYVQQHTQYNPTIVYPFY